MIPLLGVGMYATFVWGQEWVIFFWETGWIIPPSRDGWILPSLVDEMDNTFVGRWIDTAFVGGRDESELRRGHGQELRRETAWVIPLLGDNMSDTMRCCIIDSVSSLSLLQGCLMYLY